MSSDNGRDQKLVQHLEGCACEQHGSLQKLYTITSAHLFAVSLRILKDREQAEDCLQTAYIKIWKNAGSYNIAKARPMTWMNTIVRNTALDMLRRKKVQEVSDDDQLAQVADNSPSHDEQLALSRNSESMHRCLANLSDQQKVCIELAYFEGLTHQEMAEQLEYPLGSVKTWIRRGLARLRTCLSGI
ncbi:RNA polymerase sigma factor [Sansalvadorimonas verongulae]|uniref:RNA polymerase sigma factor n=1 Tax=Sansalvadorimonas verongulae TaxID=2172824 RepID=UPI0012BBA187|nr:sigma-70 family RNA polymerase sigma factor [Sansalvadorimonas verongulae]MTI12890.1 sigma-70 family RNA polymerase sigma factor [Sansalvadorimonas verongulae]